MSNIQIQILIFISAASAPLSHRERDNPQDPGPALIAINWYSAIIILLSAMESPRHPSSLFPSLFPLRLSS